MVSIARLGARGVRVAHCILPAWEADEQESVSEPFSIALSFTSQHGATREPSGRAAHRTVLANTLGAAGGEPIAWLRTDAPSELVEVTASRELRLSVAEELGVPDQVDLAPLFDGEPAHPVAWAVAARLRSAARGGQVASALEIETLARLLYAETMVAHLGGRHPSRRWGLDRRRLRRVTERIEADIEAGYGSELRLAELADQAALTPFHFLRSFRAATGITPHAYVAMRRLERVREAIERGRPPRRALEDAGYVNVTHGRRAFQRHFGHSPEAVTREDPGKRSVNRSS